MGQEQDKAGFSARVFAWLFFPVFAVAVLLPAVPEVVWTARDAAVQILSALVFAWVLWTGWRESRQQPNHVFSLDIVDLLLIGVLGWFTVSAGNSKQPFESSITLRAAFAAVIWWFALRTAWRRWPALFNRFLVLFFGVSAVTAFWIIAQTVQARWGAPHAVFTKSNLWAAGAGVVLLGAGSLLRKRIVGTVVLLAGVLSLNAALTIGLALEQRSGPFPNVNIAAGFLGMALIIALFKGMKGGLMWRILQAVLFLAWAVTQSRGAFLSMSCVAVLVLIRHMEDIERYLTQRTAWRWALAGLVILIVLTTLVPMTMRFFNAQSLDPRSNLRWHVWESGVKIALQAPLLGYGPGTFGEVYPYFRHPDVWATQTAYAHCEYLQAAAECGWPSLLGILLLLGVALFNLRKRMKSSREAEWTFFLLLLVGIHSTVDFTFHEWSIQLAVLTFAAYAMRQRAAGEMDLTMRFSGRTFALSVLALGLLVLLQAGWFSALDYFARNYYHLGVKAQNDGDLNLAEMRIRKSLSFRSDFVGSWNSLGVLELERFQKAKGRADALRHARQARGYFEKAMSVAAYSVAARENYIGFLETTGALPEALAFQRGLTAGMPGHPPHYVQEARILMEMNKPADAVPFLDEAVRIDAYYMPARVLRAEALERSGNGRGALKEYKTIREILSRLHVRDDEGIVERNIRRLGGR